MQPRKSKLKLCLIIHSLGIGGMERVMSQLATRFSEKPGTEVHLVLTGIKREILYPIPDSVIVHKPGFQFDNRHRKLGTLRTLLFIRKTVKSIHPDSILSFGEMWNNLVLLALKGLSCPVYVSDRSQPDKDLGRLQNLLRNRLYPAAAGYIAQTGKAADICIENGWNSNVRVIGNPVRRVKAEPETIKENMVLTVGRLIPTKHTDQLIQMFAELDVPDWKLVVVGGNAKRLNLMEELQELVSNLGMEERIILAGEQKNVDGFYRRAKIFAFTSSSEGFPNVIGEALSAGLPVIAYDCVAGPSDMIKNGENGFLIPLYDQEAFKMKLLSMMTSPELVNKQSLAASESIEKFSVSGIAEEFFSFIAEKAKQGVLP